MYNFLLVLHRLALRLDVSKAFFETYDRLHRRFGLPALQPVRVKRF